MDISKAIDKKFGAEREIVSSYETHDIRNNGLMDKKGSVIVNVTKPSTQEAKEWDGYGTALKPANEPLVLAQKPFTVVPVDLEEKISPANEPICVARKPLSEKTIVDNILKWGTGGINIDESRIETDDVLSFGSRKLGDGKCTPTTEGVQNVGGRFPTNVILDEEAAMILDEQSGVLKSGDNNISTKEGFFIEHKLSPPGYVHVSYGDTGGASRFFYCAKTSPGEKGKKITHPTVKPIKLMEYLITLVTPENAIVLDPFMGSGTTAISAFDSKRNFIGFENNLEYYNMISPLFKPPVKE
jgi:site-specific DNA-methyltransferase (adenine-specific)